MFAPIAKLAEWASHPHKKRVYMFHEGSASDKAILGTKGANLCEMVRMKIPVPQGFVVTTETCIEYNTFQSKSKICEMVKGSPLPDFLQTEYKNAIHELERQSNRKFGGTPLGTPTQNFPLLLSVRAGSSIPVVGITETILNLGMNDDVAASIVRLTNNAWFAFDAYRRFLEMFGTVVLGVDRSKYAEIVADIQSKRNVKHHNEFTVADLQLVVERFKQVAEVPTDVWEQLHLTIVAIFQSWYSPRATAFRDIHNIRSDLGVAAIVQSMAFGNLNKHSGTGVCFTRHPATGEKIFDGEFLAHAEGSSLLLLGFLAIVSNTVGQSYAIMN